jgi:hypothetical protein
MSDPNASITVDSPKPQPILDATYPVAPPTSDPMIDVFDPSGVRGQIPQSKASAAFQNQYKFATQDADGNWKPEQPISVSMKDANGKFSQNGFVPLSKAGQGLKAGDLQIGPTYQQKFNNTQGSNIGTAGIDPFLMAAGPKIADAAKSTAKVLRTGGGTLAKIALNPTPTGIANAFADEAAQQQADGGIPNSRDVVVAPFRELAGERQPGESATLGFTGHDPSQQPLLTRTATAADSLLGGDPAAARAKFSQGATFDAAGNRDAANAANQGGTADLLAVPLATAGTARLLGSGIPAKVGSSTADAASDVARLTRLRTFPASSLTPDELLARTLTNGSILSKLNPLKGGSAQSLLDLHDATQSALPRIANSANSLGLNIASADDLLSAIKQAKSDLLAEHQGALGPDETLADIGPNQRAALHEDMDALNNVQKLTEELQAKDVARAASKAKIPTSKGEAINKIAQGAGKYAATRAVGNVIPLGGPVARASLNAAGITSAFSDLSSGIKGLTGASAAPTALDAALAKVFSHPDLAQLFERPEGAGNLAEPAPSPIPEALRPYLGDLSVQHETNIAPPRQPHGEAIVTPEEDWTDPEPTRPPYQPYVGDRTVVHDSVIAPPETPHGFANLSPESTLYPSAAPDIYERAAAASVARGNDIPDALPEAIKNIVKQAATTNVPTNDVTPPPGTKVQVPLMITRQMEADLRARGISQPEIDRMTPAQAHVKLREPAPSPIPEVLANLIGSADSRDLGGLGSVETGANPSTPVGSRPVTRNVTRPPQAPFDANNLAPDQAFKFSRSAAQSGEDAATEWLTAQSLGRLKSMASGRNINFDGSMDPKNLRAQLINAVADDLSDHELQNFHDQAVERSRFSAREGRSKGAAAAAPLTGQDLIRGLQQMAAARKTPVPEPIASAIWPPAAPEANRSFISGPSATRPAVSLGKPIPVPDAAGVTDYPILDANGNRLGHARIAVRPDGTAEVGWFGPDDRAAGAPLNLGAAGVKELMRQFAAEHPEVQRFTGKKLSGAHATETEHGTQTIPVPKAISDLIFPLLGEMSA